MQAGPSQDCRDDETRWRLCRALSRKLGASHVRDEELWSWDYLGLGALGITSGRALG